MYGVESSRPPSTAYAVFTSKFDASRISTYIHAGKLLGVTSCHVVPLSAVRWINPLLVPAHRTPSRTGDAASAVIAFGRSKRGRWPVAFAALLSFVAAGRSVRSGLIVSQLWPPFNVSITYCVPRYNACGFSGENRSGGICET